MPKQEKVDAVTEIKQLFGESSSYFVTEYQGLNVADMTVLRKNLREGSVRYLVAKNTLFKLAAKEAGAPNLDQFFTGPTAVAFVRKDASVAAKILNDSFKEKQLPRVKVFVVDNHVHDGADIQRLADLPSREVLLSQVVAAVESPLSALVGAVDAVFTELIGTIDALAEKKKTAA
ncbi:MAG: 50S ribosomal protein L10 [Candidatus Zixiibacteriota bacterium]